MQSAAVITKLSGSVTVERGGTKVQAIQGMELYITDVVHTGSDGKVEMRFRDETELDLHHATEARLADFVFDESGTPPPSFAVDIMQGLARTATGKVVELNPDGFAINTPLGTAGIRGTVIWTQVTPSQVVFTVTDMGQGHMVVVSAPDGSTLLIRVPDSGVVITSKGEAKLDMDMLTPEKLQEFIDEVVGQALGDEAHSSTQSHGFFIIADAEFLASIGALDVGDTLGYLPSEDSALLLATLDQLGFSMDEHFLIDTHISGDDPSPPPPPGPYNYIYGSDGDDYLVGTSGMDRIYAYGGNDYIAAGKGDDTIYCGSGRDTIMGGYGSSDEIYKEADLGGSRIYGDAESLSGAVGDADLIVVGLTSANSHRGQVYGDADSMMNNAMPGNDTIEVIGTFTKGTIAGDAETMYDVRVGTDPETGDLAYGQDSITVGAMTGGTIYGDAVILDGALSGSAPGAFGDTITVGKMSDAIIYADFFELTANADTSGLSGSNAFADSISVTGAMKNSVIYGDAHVARTDNVIFGDDTIVVKGNMTGSTIIGDVQVFEGVNLQAGNDVITVNGNFKQNAAGHGYISGDLLNERDNAAQYGNDTITVKGEFQSGSLYGDSRLFSNNSAPGNDSITIATVGKEGFIYGEAKDITDVRVTAQHGGNDTITITSLHGHLHGDAAVLNGTISASSAPAKGAFSDVISIGTMTADAGSDAGSAVYGDFDIVASGAQSNLSGSNHQKAFSDSITVGTLRESFIYGDAGTLQAVWQIGGHDNIQVDIVDGGNIAADFYRIESGADFSVLGNDTISLGSVDAGSIYGDITTLTFVQSTVAIYDSNDITFGDDLISVSSFINNSDIYGDSGGGTGLRAKLGNDTIDASNATLSGMTDIYGDAVNLSGADISDSAKLGQDVIRIGSFNDQGVNIYGDASSLEGDIVGSQQYAFNDNITVANMGVGNIYGDFKETNYYPSVESGNYSFGDNISIGHISGGAVHGDFGTLDGNVYFTSFSGCQCFSDTITIGTLDGTATIYGDAQTIANMLITDNASGCFSDSISITNMNGGTVYGDAIEVNAFMDYNGGSFFKDTITIGTMTAGDVYGDVRTIQYTDNNPSPTNHRFGGNQISITNMSGGSVYGSSDALVTSGPEGQGYVLGSNSIHIGTLSGTGTVYGFTGALNIGAGNCMVLTSTITIGTMNGGTLHSLYGNGISGTLIGDDSGSNVTIDHFISGSLNLSSASDTLTLGSLVGYNGATINLGGSGATNSNYWDYVTFQSGFAYDVGDTINFSGVSGGGHVQVSLSGSGLQKIGDNAMNEFYLADTGDLGTRVLTLVFDNSMTASQITFA